MDSLLCCCKRCENSDAPIDTNLHATTLCCVSGNVQFDLKDGTSLDSSQENTRSSFKKYLLRFWKRRGSQQYARDSPPSRAEKATQIDT